MEADAMAAKPAAGSVREVLQRRCGTSFCHATTRSGFYAGPDGRFTVNNFVEFLHSNENSIFNPYHDTVYQDMNQPLAHYFLRGTFDPADAAALLLGALAAAGVVADSVPELEWRETEHKARALLRASELVAEGVAPEAVETLRTEYATAMNALEAVQGTHDESVRASETKAAAAVAAAEQMRVELAVARNGLLKAREAEEALEAENAQLVEANAALNGLEDAPIRSIRG